MTNDSETMKVEQTHEARMNDVIASIVPSTMIRHQPDEDYVESWIAGVVLREKLAFLHVASWQTAARVADIPHEALLSAVKSTWTERAVLTVRDMLVYVTVSTADECTAWVYASRYSPGDAEAAVDQLKAWLLPKAARQPDRVLFGFRYAGDGAIRHRKRAIEAPAWAGIRGNYAAPVQEAIDRLCAFKPGDDGRVILLHGLPGTGKTYVIRALAREWRAWSRFEYIADPERFFGNAAYMMDVLLDRANDDDDGEENAPQRWRVLVVEDAGELLARDAKAHQGQGLSRLLNMSEGLIGQGLRVITIISTNELLAALNDAVARPGRTAAEVEFTPLTIEECNAWLAANDPQCRTVSGPMTLAELYAFVAGRPYRKHAPPRPIGFGRN